MIFLIFKNGVWEWGFGDWGLGIGPNPQSPIPIFLRVKNKIYSHYILLYINKKKINEKK